MRQKSWPLIITFALPGVLLYGLFVIYPVVSSLYMSLFQWRGMGAAKFIAIRNYVELFQDPDFWNAVINTLRFVAYQIPIMLGLALVFSLFISLSQSRLAAFYRSLVFLPNILPIVAVAALWTAMLHPLTGAVNNLLTAVGLGEFAKPWLGQPSTAIGAIVWVDVWRMVGFYTVLLLSGILNVPSEVIEAARVDGATTGQISVKVILHLLRGPLQVAAIFIMVNALKIFETPQLMTGGGPNRHTQPVSLYMYEQAFQNFSFGYAATIGVIFSILVFCITIVVLRLQGADKQ